MSVQSPSGSDPVVERSATGEMTWYSPSADSEVYKIGWATRRLGEGPPIAHRWEMESVDVPHDPSIRPETARAAWLAPPEAFSSSVAASTELVDKSRTGRRPAELIAGPRRLRSLVEE
jgi:hypothetical protein